MELSEQARAGHLQVSSFGKWLYTVWRWTPARSAIALIEVRAGPSSMCSATAASTIRRRVSFANIVLLHWEGDENGGMDRFMARRRAPS